MSRFCIEETIEASPDVVFEHALDIRNSAEKISSIHRVEVLTEGPIGVGTRFRETRVMFGKEATEELEITDVQPGRSYTVEAESCGAHFSTVVAVEAVGDSATRLSMTTTSRAVTLLGKLMSPLSLLMIGPMKKCMQQDLADLKIIAEAEHQPVSS